MPQLTITPVTKNELLPLEFDVQQNSLPA